MLAGLIIMWNFWPAWVRISTNIVIARVLAFLMYFIHFKYEWQICICIFLKYKLFNKVLKRLRLGVKSNSTSIITYEVQQRWWQNVLDGSTICLSLVKLWIKWFYGHMGSNLNVAITFFVLFYKISKNMHAEYII